MSIQQHLEELAATTRAITASRDAAEIARLVVSQAVLFTDADTALLLLGRPAAPARVAAAQGRGAAAAGRAGELDETTPGELQRWLEYEPGDQFLSLPLAHEEVRGLLVVHQRREPDAAADTAWTDSTRTLLAALADQAAIALEHAEWRAQAERALQTAGIPRPAPEAPEAAFGGAADARDETRFRQLLEAAPDALLVVGSNRCIHLANAQAEALFGYSRDELIGAPVEMLLPEGARKRHARHMARYFAAPQARAMGVGLELHARHKEGLEILVEISLSPLVTPEGTLVLSAIRDVTRRRRAETRFSILLDAAPDPIVITDAAGRIVLVNRETERVFGYAREELLNQPVEVLLPERFRRQHVGHRAGYQAAPRTRTMGMGLELAARRRDGSEFPVEISLSPSQAEDGLLIISVIRDVSERKRAEARFRSLLEAAPDAMVISNPDGEILLVNSQAERLFGGSREALVGQPVETLIPERLRERHVGHRTAYVAAPTVREMGSGLELFARRADGGEIPVEISLSPLEADEGLLITSSIRDVSERRRALEALRESEERFRSAFQHSPIAMSLADLDGRFLQVNQALALFTGYSEEELLSLSVPAISHPEDLATDLQLLQQLLRDELPSYSLEKRYLHKTGEIRWGRLSVSAVRDREGRPIYCIRETEDITDRRRAEEELRQQAATLQEQARLIDLAHDAVLVRDLEDQVVLWNQGAEEIYGFTPAEARGRVTHRLLRTQFPGSREQVNAALLAQGRWEGELVHTTRSGSPIIVASRQVLQRDHGGAPRAILEINRDITQQKQADDERMRLLESERDKSEQLTLSIREAHHRIKNNLQAITDLLSLELASTAEPASHQALRESIERIRAIALVHDFLSRDQDFEQVEVHRVVERLVPMVLRGSGLQPEAVEVEIATTPLLLPSKQATALALVVNELVSNAVKHAFGGGRGGRLQVFMREEEGRGRLTVQDDGPGLRPDFDLDTDANVGLQVVVTLVQSNLAGRLLFDGSRGVRAEVTFSLAGAGG